MAQKSVAAHIAEHARGVPDAPAYIAAEADRVLTWAEYDTLSNQLAGLFVELGFAPGERLGILLPDGPGVHVAFVAAEKAGLIAVGIGPRAGAREIRHLLGLTGAAGLLTRAHHGDFDDMAALFEELREGCLALRHHLVIDRVMGEGVSLRADGAPAALPEPSAALAAELARRRLSPDDVFLLNSTSGTTGMPKCVVHDQQRWLAFHELAVSNGDLNGDDVFMSVVPAPFGFGIWTAHVSPTLLRAPTVLMARFDPEAAVEAMERHRVSVLAAVSTQFIMMLNSPAIDRRDLSALRVMFTGGEAVPYERAAEFEDRTGAKVLQFYGSNETGAVSGTRMDDSQERRLATAGRVIPEMNVRLFDEEGRDVTPTGYGQPAVKGPTLSRGYWGDEAANAKLVRKDGWMLLGDIVHLDRLGYLSVVGRTDDFIIRGGKNVSAVAVEEQVTRHPAVALAAAVAMPDPVFGERVCCYVELREGAAAPSLEALVEQLAAREVSKEYLPERLVILDALPRGSGGKVAKGELREDIRRRIAEESRAGEDGS